MREFDPHWDAPVWGADGIAAELNINRRRVYHLLHNDLIDADKVGATWVSTRRRLLSKIVRPNSKDVEAA